MQTIFNIPNKIFKIPIRRSFINNLNNKDFELQDFSYDIFKLKNSLKDILKAKIF